MGQSDTRLNKFLAHKLGFSRREADQLIEQGRILLDGKPAALGSRLSSDQELVVDGRVIDHSAPNYLYIALNKPPGYVCSRHAQDGTPTIYDLLPARYHELKTAGRLDKDSSGIIILSNDGDFIFKMTHPQFHKDKLYVITLDKDLEPLHRQMISDHGIALDDGVSRLQLERLDDNKTWRVVMHEGRNRQIRRTFSALGYKVVSLHRTEFGTYKLDSLPPGQTKPVTP